MEQSYPSSHDVERAVIGAMINFPVETIGMVARSGSADLFTLVPYSIIYSALEHLHEHGEPVEYLTLLDRLQKDNALDAAGGEATILAVMHEAFTDVNIEKHIEMLREKALLRKLITVMGAVRDRCFDHTADSGIIMDFLRGHIQELREFEDRKGGTLTDQVREWVLSTRGVFLSSDIHRELQISTVVAKKNCSKVLSQLVNDGVIERYGDRRVSYRSIEGDCEKIDWKNARAHILVFRWPGSIERYVEIMPGNVIIIAGEANAGKTAYLLNVVRMNMEIHEDFYRIGGRIKAVFDRLRHGIAIIAIQKSANTDIGRGGSATLEKPRLYLSMKPHRLTIVKGKNWASHENPNGLSSTFKLLKGARFAFDGWGREVV